MKCFDWISKDNESLKIGPLKGPCGWKMGSYSLQDAQTHIGELLMFEQFRQVVSDWTSREFYKDNGSLKMGSNEGLSDRVNREDSKIQVFDKWGP